MLKSIYLSYVHLRTMKRIKLEINPLEIHQGEIMGESFDASITIHISEKELKKFMPFNHQYLRIDIQEAGHDYKTTRV